MNLNIVAAFGSSRTRRSIWVPARRMETKPVIVLRLAIAVLLAGVAASGAALFGFSVDATGIVHALPACIFREITGVPCPGCGMTRAFLLLGQLRLAESFAAHPLAIPLLLGLAWSAWWGREPRGKFTSVVVSAALAATVGIWLVRLVMDRFPT